MTLLFGVVSLASAFLLLVPILLVAVECFAAILSDRKCVQEATSRRPKIAVLVPAHNEAAGIGTTLASLMPQLSVQDQLVVIADNCEDATAAVARNLGAIAIERRDQERRGKGYALDFGLKFLEANPPEVVVIMDADCVADPGSIEKISRQAIANTRPVQATYLMEQPASLKAKDAISFLAFMVKNLVRPVGLNRLGLPCLLTGTGMAFPWSVIQTTSLASGNLVEDMKLALDLAIAGYPPMFCLEANVTGVLPQQSHAVKSQRTRWEHGHLQTILTQVPRLIRASIQKRRFDLLIMALDLCIPPLSLLVILWLVAVIVATIGWLLGGTILPGLILVEEGVLIFGAVVAAWAKFARADLPLRTLLSAPLYIAWKLPLYFAFLVKPEAEWVRTERDPQVSTSESGASEPGGGLP